MLDSTSKSADPPQHPEPSQYPPASLSHACASDAVDLKDAAAMFACDHTTHVPPGARCQACHKSRQATVKHFDQGRWCESDSHIHDGSAVVRNRRFAVVVINEFVHAARSKRRLDYVNDCHTGPNVAETARTNQYTHVNEAIQRVQEASRTSGPCLATCPCPRAVGQSEQERRRTSC